MNLENIILNEVGQKEEDKYLYVDSKIQHNQKHSHRHRKQTCGYQRGKRVGRNKLRVWD